MPSFWKRKRGASGKDAVIVILDRDITQMDLRQLKDVQVDMTIKDGRVVFDRNV